MAYTQLSIAGTPGKRYSFTPKDAADSHPKGEGVFTALSVIGLPGQRHSFIAKSAADSWEKGVGQFTGLSVVALPGKRYSFVAKEGYAAEVSYERAAAEAEYFTGAGYQYVSKFRKKQLAQIQREDEEILSILMQAITSEIL